MVAISKALGHGIDIDDFNDRLALQKGCFILNIWGQHPMYDYNLYVRGPYSSAFADDYYELAGNLGDHTDVPDELISRLAGIYDKGLGYAEAYATLLLLRVRNPNSEWEGLLHRAHDIKPRLYDEIEEAYTSLREDCTSIPAS